MQVTAPDLTEPQIDIIVQAIPFWPPPEGIRGIEHPRYAVFKRNIGMGKCQGIEQLHSLWNDFDQAKLVCTHVAATQGETTGGDEYDLAAVFDLETGAMPLCYEGGIYVTRPYSINVNVTDATCLRDSPRTERYALIAFDQYKEHRTDFLQGWAWYTSLASAIEDAESGNVPYQVVQVVELTDSQTVILRHCAFEGRPVTLEELHDSQ